jgi:hypothetical protein
MITLRRQLARVRAQLEGKHAPPLPDIDPLTFFTETTGYAPDDYQASVLTSAAERIQLVAGRQVGKTTTAACLAAYICQHQTKSLTLIVSPSLRQSSEVFRRVMELYHAQPLLVPLRAKSLLRAEWVNGARVVALPASTTSVRGYTPDLLILDEAAYCPEALWQSLSPSLAVSRGRVLALSTPNGRGHWFCRTWEADESWLKVHQSSEACPRIDPAFLARERSVMPPWMYHTEYLGLFVEIAGRVVFRPELVRQSVAAGIPPFTFTWEQSA